MNRTWPGPLGFWHDNPFACPAIVAKSNSCEQAPSENCLLVNGFAIVGVFFP